MTNAQAPITGGVICPPQDATASTAAAKFGVYPAFFIMGIVMLPTVATLADVLPVIDPKKELATMATLAGPPVMRPGEGHGDIADKRGAARLHEHRPKITKSAMSVADTLNGMPKIPPSREIVEVDDVRYLV